MLSDGRVLVTGGDDCVTPCGADVYNAAATSVSASARMSIARGAHTATRLGDGTVLVVGGYDATAELFDPSTDLFVAAGAMAGTRQGHTATLLQDGNVLLVGGSGQFASMSAELYLANGVTPLSLAVTPATATVQVGAARAFSAIDHLGHTRADAQWSIDNQTVATIDPETGILTAAAAGSATVTATISSISGSAQVAVTAGEPAVGTPLWTVATPAGATSRQLIPASGAGLGGPSILAIAATTSETEVQGLTSDGQHQWRVHLMGAARQVVPNESGGAIVTTFNGCDGGPPIQLTNIDGTTGMVSWQAVATAVCNRDLPQIAIRHDGAVAVSTPGNIAGFPNLMMLDGETGAPLSAPSIPQSTFTSIGGQQTPGYSRVGPTMVDVDGTVHLLYEKRFLSYPPQVVDTGIWLMSVRTDQTYTTRQLNTTTQNVNLFPGRIIPDGQDGLIASWIDSPIVPAGQPPAQSTFRAMRIASGGGLTPYDLPITPPLDLLRPPDSALPTNPELVLGQDDRAFVSYANAVGGFAASSGASAWSHTSANDVTMLATAADASLIAKTLAADGTDTILRFPPSGGLLTSTLGFGSIGHVVKDIWSSSGIGSAIGSLQGEAVDWATTGWFQPSQRNQRRVFGVYPSPVSAAFELMDFLRPLSDKHEWGGLICASFGRYQWGRFVTSGFASEVDVLGQTSCSVFGTAVATVHVHVPSGQTEPSHLVLPNDVNNANANSQLTYYLNAPRQNRSLGYRYWTYQGPNVVFTGVRHPSANVFRWNGSSWIVPVPEP